MAEIELAPLSDRLDEDELLKLSGLLDKAGVSYDVNSDHASQVVARRLSEDVLTEFLDRLEAHDVAAEIYLPVEFDVTVTVGDYRVGSAQSLSAALEELREELDVEEEEEGEEEEEEDDDDEDDAPIVAAQLKNIWRLLNDACEEALDRKVPLHVKA